MNYSFKDVKNICLKKGYRFWAENGEFNTFLFGVRSGGPVDLFNDGIGVAYIDGHGEKKTVCFGATTDPGRGYLKNRMGNPKGTAILCPGQYRACWKIGVHARGREWAHKAMVQANKAFKVWRDFDRDGELSPKGKAYDDVTGLNMHTVIGSPKTVGRWSAGCQVVKCPTDHQKIMALAELSKNNFGNSFSYTLFKEKDFEGIRGD